MGGAIPTITVDLDTQCPRCGQWEVPCLSCAAKDVGLWEAKGRTTMEATMSKAATTQGVLGTITTKPIDGGGLAVKVTYSFLAKGKSRSALMDLLAMQEQTVEVAVTSVQTSLPLSEDA